jgi:diguanylate cyclase (GGDEF)-like protein
MDVNEYVAPASPPPLVLVANDQEWLSRSIESILGPSGFAVVHAHTGRQALELARRTRPDALIVDAGMPDLAGIEVCRILRADPRFASSTPIMMTSAAAASRADRLAAYRSGVWEYWTQPLDTDALILKLWNFVQSKQELDRCHSDSLLDDATGLYNVRGLTRRAQELGAEAARRHSALACIAISPAGNSTSSTELDPGSDADGSTAQVTRQIGELFRRTARVSDAVGRLGRSEFAIIAPATETKGVIRLIERIREEIESLQGPARAEERPLRINAGYCAVTDFAASDVDAVELLVRASTALRHSKGNDARERIASFEDVPVPSIH